MKCGYFPIFVPERRFFFCLIRSYVTNYFVVKIWKREIFGCISILFLHMNNFNATFSVKENNVPKSVSYGLCLPANLHACVCDIEQRQHFPETQQFHCETPPHELIFVRNRHFHTTLFVRSRKVQFFFYFCLHLCVCKFCI